MTDRTFAAWVEPIATQASVNRAEIVQVAGQVAPKVWSKASPLENWSYKDLLAHIAGDTDKNVQNVLRSVVAGQQVDPSRFSEIDAKNARDVERRRTRSVDELLDEIERDRETVLDLLAQLTEEAADLRQADFPLSLGEALKAFPDHDATHLAQLKTALEAKA